MNFPVIIEHILMQNTTSARFNGQLTTLTPVTYREPMSPNDSIV
jgi:hypothetical protein